MSDFSVSARCRKHGVTFAPDDGGCPGCEYENEANNKAWDEFVRAAQSVVHNADNDKREEFCCEILDVYFNNRDFKGHLYAERMAKDLQKVIEAFGVNTELERIDYE